MNAIASRFSPKVLILIILALALLVLFILLPGLFSWGSSKSQSDFDRQYQENLEKAREDGTLNYAAPGDTSSQR